MEFFMAASLVLLSFLTFWKAGGSATAGLRGGWIGLGMAIAAQVLAALVVLTGSSDAFEFATLLNAIGWAALGWGIISIGLNAVGTSPQPSRTEEPGF